MAGAIVKKQHEISKNQVQVAVSVKEGAMCRTGKLSQRRMRSRESRTIAHKPLLETKKLLKWMFGDVHWVLHTFDRVGSC